MSEHNDRILERIRGVAPEPMTPADYADPRNPNTRNDNKPSIKPGWKDPTCPKCGIVLGNRMSYACGHSYCPSGLN